MRAYFILVMLLVYANTGIAQTTFNKLYEGYYLHPVETSPNTYTVLGTITNEEGWWRHCATRFDDAGNILDKDTFNFRDYPHRSNTDVYSTLTKLPDNNFIFLGYIQAQGQKADGIIVKYNTTITDTIFTRNFGYRDTCGTSFQYLAVLPSNEVLVMGRAYLPPYRPILLKYSATGELLWVKHYDPPSNYATYQWFPTDMKLLPNGTVFMTGQIFFSGYQDTARGTMALLDAEGNIIWQYIMNDYQYSSSIGGIVSYTADTIFVIRGRYLIPYSSNINKYPKETIILKKPINAAPNVFVPADTLRGKLQYYATGQTNDPTTNTYLCTHYEYDEDLTKKYDIMGLVWLDAQGDSLRGRFYRNDVDIENTPIDFWQTSFISNKMLTSDGGILIVGDFSTAATPNLYPNGANLAWIMKVGGDGCEVPNCWVDTEEWYPEVPAIKVYPNPTTALSRLDLPPATKPYEVQLYNLYGQLMGSYALRAEAAEFSVATLPAGVYLCRVSYEGKLYGTVKVVVMR